MIFNDNNILMLHSDESLMFIKRKYNKMKFIKDFIKLFFYFKFLRVRYTNSIDIFRQNFYFKDNDVCNKRLHNFINI